MTSNGRAHIDTINTGVYRFPTPEPEADGTLSWDATTAVTVEIRAGGMKGVGWTYSSPAAATVINQHLSAAIRGLDPMDVAFCWSAMHRACRNIGTRGLVMQAISAVDIALWDLKAHLLDAPLGSLFGAMRSSVPVYGSGGFTTLSQDELAGQVQRWSDAGCTAMKIKIAESWGGRVDRDLERIEYLRELADPAVELMVDANGGYTRGQARRIGRILDELGVVWFEEPVSSDDVEGLGLVRDTARCDVAAGEYVSDLYDAQRLVGVVDCLQLDATRCGGYTGWLRGAAVAAGHNMDVSAHCAPSLHGPVAAAVPNLRHVEWFVDHARLEPQLVDGSPEVRDGAIQLDASAVGHGMRISPRATRYCLTH
ncbi:MAG: mandelate racemase [Actinomycetota bacterium]|nr:mandelate racemase [Actinomycetota bacterium]